MYDNIRFHLDEDYPDQLPPALKPFGAVPPLAENADNETQESADVEEPTDEADTVLGLDESARDGASASEPDEQQK